MSEASGDQQNVQKSERSETGARDDRGEIGPPRTPGPTDSSPQHRVADRPHWITIALGFVGPGATVVAVLVATSGIRVSQRAVDVTERAAKVAQRAYLTLENGRFSAWGLEPPFLIKPKHWGQVNFDFDVRNFGRTPADIVEYSLEFGFPAGWELHPYSNGPKVEGKRLVERQVGYLRQDGTLKVKGRGAMLFVDAAAAEAANKFNASLGCDSCGMGVRVNGKLTYRDAFGDLNEIQWCWESFVKRRPPAAPMWPCGLGRGGE